MVAAVVPRADWRGHWFEDTIRDIWKTIPKAKVAVASAIAIPIFKFTNPVKFFYGGVIAPLTAFAGTAAGAAAKKIKSVLGYDKRWPHFPAFAGCILSYWLTMQMSLSPETAIATMICAGLSCPNTVAVVKECCDLSEKEILELTMASSSAVGSAAFALANECNEPCQTVFCSVAGSVATTALSLTAFSATQLRTQK